MSAIGGKADMTVCACLLLRSLLGVKRTWAGAVQMSAFDPKRTLAVSRPALPECYFELIRCPVLSLGGGNATARVHQGNSWISSNVAVRRACAAAAAGETDRLADGSGRKQPGIVSARCGVSAGAQSARLDGGTQLANRLPQ